MTASFNLPLARPDFDGSELDAIGEVLASGWVSQGPVVERFERAVCDRVGARYGVATTSWTTAFHLAFLLYGIGPRHDVICPSYSFIATANVIRHVGATPQFVDIDPDTLNLDPVKTEAFIRQHYYENVNGEWVHSKSGRRLAAVEIVHQIGIPADIDAFAALARRYNFVLFEDSACAIGSAYKGRPIGSSGHPGGFSFHPRKVITTGEGGMLLLSYESLAEKARILRLHGMSLSDRARHDLGSTVYESYDVLGYNYKMTDIQAALGLAQLERLETLLRQRKKIVERYNSAFSKIDELSRIHLPGDVTRWNGQSYPIRLKKGTRDDRDRLMEKLQEKGIATRRGIPPIHREPLYRDAGHGRTSLPHTEAVSDQSLFLPIYPAMTEEDVDHVIQSVKRLLSARTPAAR